MGVRISLFLIFKMKNEVFDRFCWAKGKILWFLTEKCEIFKEKKHKFLLKRQVRKRVKIFGYSPRKGQKNMTKISLVFSKVKKKRTIHIKYQNFDELTGENFILVWDLWIFEEFWHKNETDFTWKGRVLIAIFIRKHKFSKRVKIFVLWYGYVIFLSRRLG